MPFLGPNYLPRTKKSQFWDIKIFSLLKLQVLQDVRYPKLEERPTAPQGAVPQHPAEVRPSQVQSLQKGFQNQGGL